MKNVNKVRTTRSYFLRFKDEAEAFKFLFLYKDLLVPYSEQTIHEAKRWEEKVLKSGDFEYPRRWALGDWKWLRFGIEFMRFKDEEGFLLKANMHPEDFRIINGQFEKKSLRRNISEWKFKGEI